MKKFFTFVCGLLLAVAANAKTDIKLADNNDSWSNELNVQTGECAFQGWAQLGWNFEDAPLALDGNAYFVVKLKTPSVGKLELGVGGSTGDDGSSVEHRVQFEPGETLLAVQFDKDMKNVTNLAVKNYQENAAKVEFDELFLASEAEYRALVGNELTIWSGKEDMGDYNNTVSIPASKFAAAKAGDKLKISFVEDQKQTYWQIKMVGGTGDKNWTPVFGADGTDMPENADSYTFDIDEEGLQLVNDRGEMCIQGKYLTLTKVEIISQTTGIQSLKSCSGKKADGKRYDMNGREVGKSYKGLVIVNGKKVIL